VPFDIGVHLNLTQGRPLTGERYPADLLDDQGRFPGPRHLFTALLACRRKWTAPLKAELAAQIGWVLDNGVRPSHANGHQYIELFPGVSEWIADLLKRFSIRVVRMPLERRVDTATIIHCGVRAWILAHIKRLLACRFARLVTRSGLNHTDGFFGSAYAGRISMAVLSEHLYASSADSLTEIPLHPGARPDSSEQKRPHDAWLDPLATQRQLERDVLCSPVLIDMLRRHGLRLGRLSVLDRYAQRQ
jgi:predicted glycoside hydrolase/deacetylase ChbG (UPF0249 family)